MLLQSEPDSPLEKSSMENDEMVCFAQSRESIVTSRYKWLLGEVSLFGSSIAICCICVLYILCAGPTWLLEIYAHIAHFVVTASVNYDYLGQRRFIHSRWIGLVSQTMRLAFRIGLKLLHWQSCSTEKDKLVFRHCSGLPTILVAAWLFRFSTNYITVIVLLPSYWVFISRRWTSFACKKSWTTVHKL